MCCVYHSTASGLIGEVPEAVRVANQQIFQHQVTPTDANLPNPLQNILLNSNDKNSPMDLQNSILANMRFLRTQGFKDGLALGLSRYNGLVNNNNNNSQNNNINSNDTVITSVAATNQQQPLSMPMPSIPNVSVASQSNRNIQNSYKSLAKVTKVSSISKGTDPDYMENAKQKSLLRKSRQTPAPFELNMNTSIEATQNRLQQFDDLSKTFGNLSSSSTDKINVKKPNFLEEFKLVDSFNSFICPCHLN